MTQFYLQHHIEQSGRLVKIAEYACNTLADVEATTNEISAMYPRDSACFAMRVVHHTVSH